MPNVLYSLLGPRVLNISPWWGFIHNRASHSLSYLNQKDRVRTIPSLSKNPPFRASGMTQDWGGVRSSREWRVRVHLKGAADRKSARSSGQSFCPNGGATRSSEQTHAQAGSQSIAQHCNQWDYALERTGARSIGQSNLLPALQPVRLRARASRCALEWAV